MGGNKNYSDTHAYMYILCRTDRAQRRSHQKGRHVTRGQPTSAPFTTVGPPDDAAARTAFAVTTNGGISLESQVGVRCSTPKGGYPGAPLFCRVITFAVVTGMLFEVVIMLYRIVGIFGEVLNLVI